MESSYERCVPKAILRLILFNIFMNDMYLEVESCKIYNYADDNTASVAKEAPEELTMALESNGNKMYLKPG